MQLIKRKIGNSASKSRFTKDDLKNLNIKIANWQKKISGDISGRTKAGETLKKWRREGKKLFEQKRKMLKELNLSQRAINATNAKIAELSKEEGWQGSFIIKDDKRSAA